MDKRINMTMKVLLIDQLIAWLALISGLSISVVAIYYSVAGLVVIFAAAAVPIIIMGVTLEVSKLVATLWLKWNWDRAPRLIKTYLTIAVVVLMFITSIGIFGFLSKAHIDQAASGVDSMARVEQINKEIGRQNAAIDRAEDRINRIETSGVGTEANVQRQIDAEQTRINSAYERVQPAIAEQQRIVDDQIKLFQDELAKIDQELATLQGYVDTNDIRKAQAMVGTRVDGQYGPATAAAFQQWQAAKARTRSDVITRIESANTNATVKAARDEIQRVRQGVEAQIAESNTLINRLRSQLGQSDAGEVERLLNEQRTIIATVSADVDNLTEQKYQLESETRKLEAEVGPIKFIADFIYGDRADKNTLEEAVRWMILIIVAVFDPLAIVLLLASQHSFQWFRQAKQAPTTGTDPLPNDIITESEHTPAAAPVTDHTPAGPTDLPYLKSFKSFSNLTPISGNTPEDRPLPVDTINDQDEEAVLTAALPNEKRAMQRWKAEHPDNCLKDQRRLLREGLINQPPWQHYIELDDAAEEALRWAEEQAEKKRLIAWMEREGSQQVKKTREQ